MPQSKLKEFHPMVTNGKHETFTGQHGTFYKFWVVFEDGTKGNVLSTLNRPKWTVGNTYTFDLTDKGSIRNMKEVKSSESTGGSIWNDPQVIRKKCQQACVKFAVEFIVENVEQTVVSKGQLFTLASKFYEWCVNVESDKEIWDRMASLEGALKATGIKVEKIGTSADVIDMAQRILEWKP